jgi:hypothetical protein
VAVRNLEAKKSRSEIIRNYAQLAIVVIAALWTIYLFYIKDIPGLENRGTMSNAINWYRLGETDKLLLQYYVEIENKGASSFDISKIHVKAWEFSPDMQKDGIVFVDPKIIRAETPFFNEIYQLDRTPTSPFPSHYPPGTSTKNTFDWIVKGDCQKWILFSAEVYKSGEEDKPFWSSYTWWQQCPRPDQLPLLTPTPLQKSS